ncbi:hypothetical protein H072_985 [Dactylellina haptotyla CBS 200.50]|uniref:Uncharacterized protein n=1 Tax=Dactylellina haptotyla (strain CBS 200.50) TaxID=1284197 RepID=S8APX5_DACHA|nr:hypothetical protein H072_985 [Dactylellina haptotyla CBS 200.50]
MHKVVLTSISKERKLAGVDKKPKTIAFACLAYDAHFSDILPPKRATNYFCQQLSRGAGAIDHRSGGKLRLWETDRNYAAKIRREIELIRSKEEVCDYYQGGSRYARFNFKNACRPQDSGSGTIEFRAAPATENAPMTMRWVSIAVGFIALALEENWFDQRNITKFNNKDWNKRDLLERIRGTANRQGYEDIPYEWEVIRKESTDPVCVECQQYKHSGCSCYKYQANRDFPSAHLWDPALREVKEAMDFEEWETSWNPSSASGHSQEIDIDDIFKNLSLKGDGETKHPSALGKNPVRQTKDSGYDWREILENLRPSQRLAYPTPPRAKRT